MYCVTKDHIMCQGALQFVSIYKFKLTLYSITEEMIYRRVCGLIPLLLRTVLHASFFSFDELLPLFQTSITLFLL